MLNLGQLKCSSLNFKEKENTPQSMVSTITLPEFCELNNITKIDLLKLDIEGAEVQVLQNLEGNWLKKNVLQLTCEFHEFLDPSLVPAIQKIVQKLKHLGFYFLPFSRTYGDVLFINKNFIKLSIFDRIQIFVIKYKRGISRLLSL